MQRYRLQCPRCQKALQVELADSALGQTTRTRCTGCGNEFTFQVPRSPGPPAAKPPSSPKAAPAKTVGAPAVDPGDPFGNLNLPNSAAPAPQTFRNQPQPAPRRSATTGPSSKFPWPLVIGVSAACVFVGLGLWLFLGGAASLPGPLRAAVRSVAPMTDSRDGVIADLKDTERDLKDVVMTLVDGADESDPNESESDATEKFENMLREIAAIRTRLLGLLVRSVELSPMDPEDAPTQDELTEIISDDPFSEEEKDRLTTYAEGIDRKKALSISFSLQSVIPYLKLVTLQLHVTNVGLPENATPVEKLAYEQLELERTAIAAEARALKEMTELAIDADDPETLTQQSGWKEIVTRTEKELQSVTSQLKSLADRVRTAFREQTFTGELSTESPHSRALTAAIQSRLMLDRQFKSMRIGESAKEGIAEIQRSSSLVKSMYRNFKSPDDKPKEPEPVAASRSTAAPQENRPSKTEIASNPQSQADRLDPSSNDQPPSDPTDTEPRSGSRFSNSMRPRGPDFSRRGPGGPDPSGPRFGPRFGPRGGDPRGETGRPSDAGRSRDSGGPRGPGGSPPQWLVELRTLDDVREMSRPPWANLTIVLRSDSGPLDISKVLPQDADVEPTSAGFRQWLTEQFGQQFASQSNSTTHVYHLGGTTNLNDLVGRLQNVQVIKLYPEEGFADLSVK